MTFIQYVNNINIAGRISSYTVMFNGVGNGSSCTEIVSPELGLKGEDEMFKDVSVMSSNFVFRSML